MDNTKLQNFIRKVKTQNEKYLNVSNTSVVDKYSLLSTNDTNSRGFNIYNTDERFNNGNRIYIGPNQTIIGEVDYFRCVGGNYLNDNYVLNLMAVTKLVHGTMSLYAMPSGEYFGELSNVANCYYVPIKKLYEKYGIANFKLVTSDNWFGTEIIALEASKVIISNPSLIVNKQFNNTYKEGESFPVSDVELIYIDDNGIGRQVTECEVSPEGPLQYGCNEVILTYLSTSVTIPINVIKMTGIIVDRIPDKTVYNQGELFLTSGMKISAVYSDGSTEYVSDYTYSPNGELIYGTTKIVIRYDNFTVEQEITVREPVRVLKSISVAVPPLKSVYLRGEYFSPNGMKIFANYEDGYNEEITEYTIAVSQPLTENDTSAVVYYEGKSCFVNIKVKEPQYYSLYKIGNYCKSFSLPNNISAIFDLLNKKSVISICDYEPDRTFINLGISHLYRKDNENIGYGRGLSLNISERIYKSPEGADYFYLCYVDAWGEQYIIPENGRVKNCYYTTVVPESVKNLQLYQTILTYGEVERNKYLPTMWLLKGNIVKGFNASGLLVMVSDTSGNLYQINYNSNKQITEIHNLRNNMEANTFIFTYDNGYLNSISSNKSVYFSYNNGYLVGVRYSSGVELTLVYDNENKLKEIISTDGYISKISDAGSSLSVSVQSTYIEIPNGQTSTSLPSNYNKRVIFGNNDAIFSGENGKEYYYAFNEHGYLETCYEIKNNVVINAEKYEYVPYCVSNVFKAKKSLLNKKSRYEFQFETGEYQLSELNDYGRPLSKKIRNIYLSDKTIYNADISYTYENSCCVQEKANVNIKIPDNEVDYVYVTDCIYNNNSQVVKKLTYVEGEITKYGKDIVEYVYDEYGNIIKTYSYNSLQSNKRFYTSRAFDELGRQTMQKDATGRYATYFTYLNNSHNIATITSPDGEVIRYTYDSKENPIKISSETSEGNLTNNIAYSSDEIINMSCGNDDIGFTYNNERKISSVTVGSTELENIIYKTRDDIGAMPNNLTKVTNAKGEIFISNISKSGVYEKYYYNNDLKLSCDFDSYQRITSLVDSQINETVSYSYDTFGRIKEINSSLGNLEIYTYDYYGKIACEKYVGNLNREVSYDYENDSKRRLKKISFPSFSIAMSYDLYGRISTKTYCVGATEIYSQGQSYFEYGNILTNVPSQNTYSLPGQYIMFDYDSKGNINHIKYTNKHVYYTYDKHNRLIREDNQLLYSTIFYRYDDCGNLSKKLTIPYSENQDEPPVGTWQALTYSNGKLVKDFNNMSIAYDAIGNPVLYRGYRMSWTQGNQLISYYNSTFAYNARGRRIKKNNIDYYYDAKGKLIGSSDGMEYYYDESGVTAFKYNGNLYIYQKDVLNNVIGILDSSGNIVVKYVYDAWGNFWAYDSNGNTLSYSGRKSASNSTPNKLCDINPFKYRSYFYDYETGLYYLESRYYDPETCRFISPTSFNCLYPEIVGGLNMYAFCVNKNNTLSHQVLGYEKILNSNGLNPSLYNNMISENGSSPLINHVLMYHYTRQLLKNKYIAAVVGNLSYTTTEQTNSIDGFYTYSNYDNGGNSYGIGFNINSWLGLNFYASTNIGIGGGVQLTPWFSLGLEISLTEGISFSIGKISGDTTDEISVNIGWGTLGLIVAAGCAASPIPGGRVAGGLIALISILFGF